MAANPNPTGRVSASASKAMPNRRRGPSPVVVNGLMSGYWKRSFVKDRVVIETNVVSSVKELASHGIDKAAREFGKFLNRPVVVSQRSV